MTTINLKDRWNHRSHVTVCQECNGLGEVHSHRQPTIHDPYPTSPCDECDGPNDPECVVCGYDLIVRGVDCLVCDTVAIMDANELRQFDADKFAAAAKVAVAAALAQALQVAA